MATTTRKDATAPQIHGYTKGAPTVPKAPITLDELSQIKKTMAWTAEDDRGLRESARLLVPRVNAILDVWYGFMESQPQLIEAFKAPSAGAPDREYMDAVRKRFGQWIVDTTEAKHDQPWLDYQFEIARRHHRTGKNQTDGARASDIVPFRHLVALVAPVASTLRPFLEEGGTPRADVDRMQEAWRKAVLLQVILWSHPYIRDGDF